MKKTALIIPVLAIGIIGAVWLLNNNDMRIKRKYGANCKIAEKCGDMLYVDCGAAVDGPAYYLNANIEVIGTSGGLCMRGCSGAPEEWKQCIQRRPDAPSPSNN
ncbi:MAG: hypothetical protein EP349_05900 [Alphaproteobacteria bacterium]|nr:MAG: hypothetical protein EP349_05900 [Alphaproteobacteria bacterium]